MKSPPTPKLPSVADAIAAPVHIVRGVQGLMNVADEMD
jgi:hypothetical protein